MSTRKESDQQILNKIGNQLTERIKNINKILKKSDGIIQKLDEALHNSNKLQRKLDHTLFESQELVRLATPTEGNVRFMFSATSEADTCCGYPTITDF